jgi:hypothetical protein
LYTHLPNYYFSYGYDSVKPSQIGFFNRPKESSTYNIKYIDITETNIDTIKNYLPPLKTEKDSLYYPCAQNLYYSYILYKLKEPVFNNNVDSDKIRLITINNNAYQEIYNIVRIHFLRDSALLFYKTGFFEADGNFKMIYNDSVYLKRREIKAIKKMYEKIDIKNEPISCSTESSYWLFELKNKENYGAFLRVFYCKDCFKSLRYFCSLYASMTNIRNHYLRKNKFRVSFLD